MGIGRERALLCVCNMKAHNQKPLLLVSLAFFEFPWEGETTCGLLFAFRKSRYIPQFGVRV